MEFFNFGNDETFHAFKWITEGGMLNVSELLSTMFKNAGDNYWLELGDDMAYVLRDELAEVIAEKLDELTKGTWGADTGDNELGAVDSSLESLLSPLTALAFQRINYSAIAQAILIQTRKWNLGSLPEVQ